MDQDPRKKTAKIVAPFNREEMVRYFPAQLTSEQAQFRDLLVTRLMGSTSLPSLPASFVKLQIALDDPLSTGDQIQEIIAADPGIVSKILAVSQSVIYGGTAVSSLENAIMRLGLREVRKVALAGGVVKALSDFDDGVDWDAFWVRSAVVARVTEQLGNSFHPPDGSYYLSGLLQDIGRIFMRHHFPDEYHEVTRRTEEFGGSYEAERAVLGFTRSPVSAILCKKWELNPKIILAIQGHEDPVQYFGTSISDINSAAFLSCCLNVAITLADLSGLGITSVDCTLDNYESLPSYQMITQFEMITPFEMVLSKEIEKARAMVAELMS